MGKFFEISIDPGVGGDSQDGYGEEEEDEEANGICAGTPLN
jgi:hypothetical protein